MNEAVMDEYGEDRENYSDGPLPPVKGNGSLKHPRHAPPRNRLRNARPIYADDEDFAEEETVEEVVDEGRDLLQRLMIRELSKDDGGGAEHAETQRMIRLYLQRNAAQHGGVYQDKGVVQQDQIVDALSRIGDALEADRELNRLVFLVEPEASWETFQNVARRLFADGINWGRIVALFFFACKMVKRSIDSVPLVSQILEWVSGIVKAYIANWVLRRGGWRAVMEWFGPKWSQIGMAFGGFCMVSAVILSCHHVNR
ncbi:putative Apoptosis regulator BAX [Hypsibius exemplaris]|uniref:Apoptosis regulator BAX n=1 Tax=Hypsibius exemplaris TaxID=2072580 RepID=A0A1W0WTF9_HYPEX|nr:putative Apoptosis regulator BAX [Hypsibius exemplaris]